MNEIGNDEVVAALQVIIDKFGDHIEPHAVALVSQLSNAFSTYCNARDDDDDDVAMAAAQCLECIATVLKGICGQPALYKMLEPQLLPLIISILGNDGEYIEYLECALDILTFLTYFQEEISSELWQVFPLIYIAFDQWAYDYLNLMVPPLQSFIRKGPKVFMTGSTTLSEGNVLYIDLVFTMVAKTVTNDRSSESECRQALSLFMSILHNCPGQVDAYLPVINEISLGKLGQQVNADIPLTRIAVYQVLGSALYYNPQLELTELEKRGVTHQVFSKWMKDADTMDRWLPRKLTVLGLTAILILPTLAIPLSISSSIPQLIASVVRMTESMKEDAEKAETVGENDRPPYGVLEEKEEDSDEDDEGFGEDEDVTNEVDEAYKKALNGISGYGDDMASFLMGSDWEDDGEDFDEDFRSPLDEVDELLYLNDTLKGAFQREPEVYLQIQSALPLDTVNSCQRLFAAANAVRAQL